MKTSVGDNTDNAGAVSFGGTQAAPAQFQMGRVGFGPAWSNGLIDDMYNAGICTVCGNRMTPVRPGKAQCDFCETTEHMAESIVRIQRELEEAQAQIAVYEAERSILITKIGELEKLVEIYKSEISRLVREARQ